MHGPGEAVQRHIASFERGDVDAVLTDYAEDAAIQTQNGTVQGRSALRDLFESPLPLIPPGTDILVDHFSVAGDVVFITWHAEADDFSIPLVADTHVARNGKIVAQTVAVHFESSGRTR